MGAGIIELAAIGPQDKMLTGQPQMTFFKTVYRRHTNFSIDSVTQYFNKTFDFGVEDLNCKISRNGDLIYRMYMTFELPALTNDTSKAYNTLKSTNFSSINNLGWIDSIGYLLFKDIGIYIGGKLIDKHYGKWLDIWNEITDDNNWDGVLKSSNFLIDGVPSYNENAFKKDVYVPFNFWFNKNSGCALPLIALQYHDVEIRLSTRPLNELLLSDGTISNHTGSIHNPKFYVDYIHLDSDERRRFAESNHEYLIEQLQVNSSIHMDTDGTHKMIDLKFQHPIKELIWVGINQTRDSQSSVGNVPSTESTTGNSWNFYGSAVKNTNLNLDESYDISETMDLLINGNSKILAESYFFRKTQMMQYHSNYSGNYIYVYSFALTPEEYQPSGSCNFSQLDSVKLKLNGIPSQTSSSGLNITVYAVNYNVFKINSGMGGLFYT